MLLLLLEKHPQPNIPDDIRDVRARSLQTRRRADRLQQQGRHPTQLAAFTKYFMPEDASFYTRQNFARSDFGISKIEVKLLDLDQFALGGLQVEYAGGSCSHGEPLLHHYHPSRILALLPGVIATSVTCLCPTPR
jgi:hypothetical protein